METFISSTVFLFLLLPSCLLSLLPISFSLMLQGLTGLALRSFFLSTSSGYDTYISHCDICTSLPTYTSHCYTCVSHYYSSTSRHYTCASLHHNVCVCLGQITSALYSPQLADNKLELVDAKNSFRPGYKSFCVPPNQKVVHTVKIKPHVSIGLLNLTVQAVVNNLAGLRCFSTSNYRCVYPPRQKSLYSHIKNTLKCVIDVLMTISVINNILKASKLTLFISKTMFEMIHSFS